MLNKIDLLDGEERAALLARAKRGGTLAISALNGDGLPAVLARIDKLLVAQENVFRLTLEAQDGAGLAWSYRHGRVLGRKDRNGRIRLEIAASPAQEAQFRSRFGARLA